MTNEVCYENSYSSGKQQVIKSMCEKISQCESVNARTEQFCPCQHNIKVVYERDWINDTENEIPVCVEINGVHIETENITTMLDRVRDQEMGFVYCALIVFGVALIVILIAIVIFAVTVLPFV